MLNVVVDISVPLTLTSLAQFIFNVGAVNLADLIDFTMPKAGDVVSGQLEPVNPSVDFELGELKVSDDGRVAYQNAKLSARTLHAHLRCLCSLCRSLRTRSHRRPQLPCAAARSTASRPIFTSPPTPLPPPSTKATACTAP